MKYQPKIEGTERKLLESFETLTAYAKQEEKTLFASSKTASVGVCKIQRRVSEKVVLLPDYDEDKVLAAVKKHAPDFVNTKETIDKTALKKAAEKEEIDLASVGLKIQENLTTTVKVS
jgi:phage host-nuclease inhibitor protein Gam